MKSVTFQALTSCVLFAMTMQAHAQSEATNSKQGEERNVVLGTIGCTGNFRFTFEVGQCGRTARDTGYQPLCQRLQAARRRDLYHTRVHIYNKQHRHQPGQPQPARLGTTLSGEPWLALKGRQVFFVRTSSMRRPH